MRLTIRELKDDELQYGLLYLADPSEEAIADYTVRGRCYGAFLGGEPIGEYVLLPTRPFTAELVNIAVDPSHRGQGIGTALVRHAIETARSAGFKKLEVGTASTGERQIALYEKCGFVLEWFDRDFFVRHYDFPVVDEGVECRDMVRMGMYL